VKTSNFKEIEDAWEQGMMQSFKTPIVQINKHSALVLDMRSFGVSRALFAPLSRLFPDLNILYLYILIFIYK
jgi:hypothetical protein